ncbi:phospholipid-translocating P-type ATPase [Rhizophagus irregularis]|uniref:Phospholipid-transporting ATPase n=1 Tax=Rhizophagus irregularis TaxID=588596 RepID=A0A2N1NBZ4_9GLOM|nr:phospholipid-translocating P-type ATPase [Rhizophagus irregularis]
MSTNTKNESIEENMNTNISISESPITSFETVDTTNLVTENESIITQETIVTENTSPGEVKETIISTPAISEQIISTEIKVSTPTITETVESTPAVVTKSESNKKTIEKDETINSIKVNETVMNSSEDFNEKIEQKNSRGNEDNTDNTYNRAIIDENNPDDNEEGIDQETTGSPLKRTKTKIKNRTSNCKERRVYANIDLPKDEVDRKGRPKYKYVTNKIVTSKYTFWTFIPKNLFEQFRRAANLYFLFMAVLGMLPFISVNNPVLTVLPLSVVVFFTALKDGIEDRNRHQIDKQFNGAICYHLQNFVNVNYPKVPKLSFWKRQILRIKSLFKRSVNEDSNSIDGDDEDKPPSEPSNEKHGPPEWRKVIWRNVRVGDFLYLKNNDAVPADAIILSTSELEGTCFVETKDLDGETNLKPRRCIPDIKDIRSPIDCTNVTFYIDSETPNSNLYSYSGALILTEPSDDRDSEARSPVSERSSVPNSITPPEQKWKPRKTIPVDINNLLLRAHVIRNTEWVIAITIFTGVETKIMLNSSETPSKRSRIEKEMNQEVILNFFVLIILALVCAIGSAISTKLSKDSGVAIENLDSNRESVLFAAFLTFMNSLIIFQNIIPISLYISIEFVKLWQAYFIYNDLDMWDEDSRATAVPKSWNLSDDLGQIEYIFSDKTGTLTRNIMEFRQFSVAEKVYGRNGWGGKTDAEKGKELIQGKQNEGKQELDQKEIFDQYINEMKNVFEPVYSSTDPNFLTFVDPEIFRDLKNDDEIDNDIGEESSTGGKSEFKHKRSDLLKEFFTLLAVCHTVVVDDISKENSENANSDGGRDSNNETQSSGNSSESSLNHNRDKNSSSISVAKKKLKNSIKQVLPSLKQLESALGHSPNGTVKSIPIDTTVVKNLVYKAESPDEAALVAAAKNVGFAFLSRTTNYLTVDVLGKEHKFEILNILEFNSTRKRMSVIVRRPAELGGGIILYCKGADNIIIERLAKGQEKFVEATARDIEDFSNDGLRTLTLAYRELSETRYKSWLKEYQAAASSLTDRSEKIDKVSEKIEKELILLGATAIEDKLQVGVPDCIASLRKAGIKVWVLTGDKLETAINIGFAAQLLTKEMRLWVVKGSKKESVMKQFNNVFVSFMGDKNVKKFTEDGEEIPPVKEEEVHAFIVDGAALAHLLEDDNSRNQLIALSDFFHSVICCRVSPLQKAMVVELVRRGKKSTTLAIGDGANDVSMIQAANVGVGISGQEGVQASMAADYSIAQFRFLSKLLLVHGHWDYLRISEMILNFFYKNVIWVFPVLWYQIFCMFSANIFYDYSFVQLYNMIFTVAPVIILGATDQSVGKQYCLRFPTIYSLGIRKLRYSKKLFGLYFFDGIWQSLAVYFTFNFIYYISTDPEGDSAGPFSTAVAVTVVVIASLLVGFNTYYWSWFIWVFVFVEILSVFLFVIAYSLFEQSPIYGIGNQLFSDGTFWFGMPLAILIAGLPRYVIQFVKQWWYPDDLDIVRQIRKRERTEKAKEEKSKKSNQNNEKQPAVTPMINVELIEHGRSRTRSLTENNSNKV